MVLIQDEKSTLIKDTNLFLFFIFLSIVMMYDIKIRGNNSNVRLNPIIIFIIKKLC